MLTPAALLPPHPAVSHRWGNHLSNKFFLEKKFVVKHITNKHAEKVEEARKEVRGGGFGWDSCCGCWHGAAGHGTIMHGLCCWCPERQQQQACAA